MAGTRALTAVFRLVNLKMIHRSRFHFGIIIGYGALVMLIRLLANVFFVLPFSRSHSDFDFSAFYFQSILLVMACGTWLVPLVGARGTHDILGHPRLAHVDGPVRLKAHLLFTASRLPFISVVVLLAVHVFGLLSATGEVFRPLLLFAWTLGLLLAGNALSHRLVEAFRIRLDSTENLLLGLLALALLLNPQAIVRDKAVFVLNTPALLSLDFAGTGLAELGLVVLAAAMLFALQVLARLGGVIQGLIARQVQAKLLFERVPLSFLVAGAAIEAAIASSALDPGHKLLLSAPVLVVALARYAAALSSIGEASFLLFRRSLPLRSFRVPLLACAFALSLPVAAGLLAALPP